MVVKKNPLVLAAESFTLELYTAFFFLVYFFIFRIPCLTKILLARFACLSCSAVLAVSKSG